MLVVMYLYGMCACMRYCIGSLVMIIYHLLFYSSSMLYILDLFSLHFLNTVLFSMGNSYTFALCLDVIRIILYVFIYCNVSTLTQSSIYERFLLLFCLIRVIR